MSKIQRKEIKLESQWRYTCGFLDQGKEIALGAVLHDVIPTSVVSAQTDCFHNVGMMEALGDAVLGLDLVLVLFFGFALGLATKLLYGIQLSRRPLPSHEGNLGRGSFSKMATMTTKKL